MIGDRNPLDGAAERYGEGSDAAPAARLDVHDGAAAEAHEVVVVVDPPVVASRAIAELELARFADLEQLL